MKITLTNKSNELKVNLEKFLSEFENETSPHPFDRKCRILQGKNTDSDGVVFELSSWNNSIHISMIQALKTGIGEGSRGLSFLTELADKHEVPMTGIAKRVGETGLPTATLKAWYKKNGFKVASNGEMNRPVDGYKVSSEKIKKVKP
jgi:hypothetical protein